MGMPSGPTVLPFKSEKLSFSLSYKNDASPHARVELACLCFDREGQVLDYIQFNRRAALNGSLKHSSCSYLPQQDAVPGDEAIHMYPFDFAPQCEVMLLLASAPKDPFKRNDLGSSGKLQFKAHAREMGKEQLQLLDVDLSLFVGHQAAKGAGPLSNGHQTMVIAGVYTNPQGWTLSFDCTTFQEDSWGLLLPQLRSLLQRWPSLSAADNARRLPHQTVICSRKGEDAPVAALAAAAAATAAASAAVGAGATSAQGTAADAGSNVDAAAATDEAGQELPDEGTAKPEAAAATAAAAALGPVSADKLVLELGWEVFRPKAADEDEEEEEPPAVEFTLALYNLQGEEIATITADNAEAEGVIVDEEEPEEPEEQEDEQTGQAEAEQAAVDESNTDGKEEAGNSEGGEDGEEKEEVVPEEEDEETKAAKAAAKAEAAAAAAQAAAANHRPLAERFPLRRKVHLNLPELPPDTRALLLSMSNFTGSGFKNVKSLQARLVLEDPQQQQQQQQQQSEEGGEDEEEEAPKPRKKGPKQPARVLVHYRFDSVQGADAHLSQLLLLKMYKEYTNSAFAVWQQQQVPDVAALLGGQAAAAAAAAVGEAGSSGVAPERAKEVLQQILAARKQLEQELADARARAEEEGLDEEEGEPDLRLTHGAWRVRVLGVTAGGAGPEELTDTIANLLAYDGDLDTAGLRSSPAAKVAFPNRDTYFGGYAADAKSGLGLYAFANGGAYIGQYVGGKRQGEGLMILPDGGLYRGGFVADKFEGQGTYLYPDNSYYTGSWKAGKKHGQGTYWDTAAGCLRGEWVAGALKGQGQYDQPNYHFEGTFAKGVPAGPCTFTVSAFRAVDLPQPAASYIIAPFGPTLCGEGQYAVPPGAADEPDVPEGEEGEAAEPDPDKPAMPSFPKYEGLSYTSASSMPCSKPDVPFPPPTAAVATI